MSDLTGQTISHYQILEQIGQGGMAVVYKARDTRLDAEVAIKLIRRGSFPPDAYHRVIQRFEREAKSLAHLNHPNIVNILDYGEFDGAPYLVMKFMPGGTLKERLGSPMDYKEAARLLLPIARALAHAHQRGTLHRDVKPSNILLTEDGEPMLADFGIAKILEEGDGQTLTGFGVGIGTPEYMAPEQWLGKGVDGRADVYSLGVVFYELVTGCKPYQADTPGQLMDQHLHSPLPNPRKYVPGLPLAVEGLLTKALAKQPQDRYPDMNSLAIALEGLLALPAPGKRAKPSQKQITHGEAITPRKLQPAQSAADENLTFDDISEDKPNVKPGSSLPWKKIGMGLAALAVLGLLVWLMGWKIIPPIKEEVRGSRNTGTAIAATQAESARVTEIASVWTKTPSLTPSPTVTCTPTLTLTPAVTSTFTHIPTSTLIPPDCTEIGQEWVSPVDGMKLVCVPAGEFTMGSDLGRSIEKPEHTVYLDAYWIDQTEVTNSQYALCVAAGACQIPPNNYYPDSGYARDPVVDVDWYDAAAYCTWSGRLLPSEAQWEKAARGIDQLIYPWGNELDCKKVNGEGSSCDGYSGTAPVGSFSTGASPYGVLDMAGNVWEWAADWYNIYYYRTYGENQWPANPTGPTEDTGVKVMRGGSWFQSGDYLSASRRNNWQPGNSGGLVGFRCSRSRP